MVSTNDLTDSSFRSITFGGAGGHTIRGNPMTLTNSSDCIINSGTNVIACDLTFSGTPSAGIWGGGELTVIGNVGGGSLSFLRQQFGTQPRWVIRGQFTGGSLRVGYGIEFVKSRNAGDSVVHHIDIGDDYVSSTQIQLTPTLTFFFSTGISLNTGSEGPRIANNTNVQLTKIWERASLTASVRKGLTSSQGVSGISDTIDFTTFFNILLTERLSGNAGVDYSFFNTDSVNFKPFRAYGGLQYGINSWLCSGLTYTHRRLFSGSGGQNTVLQTQGNVYGNSLFLQLTASFDVWPNFGLARGQGCTVPAAAPQLQQQLQQGPPL
jgi:hypothetical protein